MIEKIQKTVRSAGIALATLLMIATASFGITATQPTNVSAAGCATGVIFPHWYDGGICEGNGNIKSPNAVGGLPKFVTIIAMNLVAMLLYVVGYVSLIFIIVGGYKFMISGDNANGTAAAKKTILNAVIGLVISIFAVAIVRFVADAI